MADCKACKPVSNPSSFSGTCCNCLQALVGLDVAVRWTCGRISPEVAADGAGAMGYNRSEVDISGDKVHAGTVFLPYRTIRKGDTMKASEKVTYVSLQLSASITDSFMTDRLLSARGRSDWTFKDREGR
jgi:hypothetical protein